MEQGKPTINRMKGVKQKNTTPEMQVRKALHKIGMRFRLHKKIINCSPDIILARHKTVIFVHGCFWHRHQNCRYATTPKTRTDYWLPKFKSNEERDARNIAQLEDAGWRVIVIWECEARASTELESRLRKEFNLSVLQDGSEYSNL
ncbi:DNA mismatch endonuclease Vsr [Pseudomonas aeruginosa]|nr:DNA mismatch endonuclease Vsr [Pseudomonas aeruginosa]